jgi:hypothetical protein
MAINAARFVTLVASSADATEGLVHTQFQFQGSLKFGELPGFDVFSFDNLAYSGLSLDMSFNFNAPTTAAFALDTTAIAFDLALSQARPNSLWNHFPLKLLALPTGSGDTRPDKGSYMPVDSPLDSDGIADQWQALSFSINLGTPGGLAAQIDFSAGLIVAWSPDGGQRPKVFIGLTLPGVKNGERAITLQSFIKIAFGDIAFVCDPKTGGYVLLLQKTSLKLLALSLPLGGSIDILLFGGTGPQDRGTLGWYAGYASDTQDSVKAPKAIAPPELRLR